MKKVCVCLIIICAVFVGSAFSQEKEKTPSRSDNISLGNDYTFKAKLRAWIQDFDADLKDDSSGTSDQLDFVSTLGLDEDNVRFNGEFDLQFFTRHHLQFGYWSYDESMSKSVGSSFNFDNKTYGFSAGIKTGLALEQYHLGYAYDFLEADNVTVTGLFAIKVFAIDISIAGTATDLTTGITQSETYTFDEGAPLPVLGLGVAFAPSDEIPLTIEAKLAGFSIGSELTYLSADLNAVYQVVPNVGIELGYRHEDLDIDIDDLEGGITFGGPFMGVVVQF